MQATRENTFYNIPENSNLPAIAICSSVELRSTRSYQTEMERSIKKLSFASISGSIFPRYVLERGAGSRGGITK